MKKCSKCSVVKPLECFYKSKTKIGVRAACKCCTAQDVKLKSKIYYENNKDIIKEKSAKWKSENFERVKELEALLYQNNKDKILQRSKDYYINHKDEILIKTKKYREKNGEKIKKSLRDNYIKNRKIRLLECKVYRSLNKDKIAQCKKQYYQTDHGKSLSLIASRKRKAMKRHRLHPSHDKKIEKKLEYYRRKQSEKDNVQYDIDHVFPLIWGGFHWHLNMQVIPHSINLEKGDKLDFFHPSILHWTDLPDEVLADINPDVKSLAEQEISLVRTFNLKINN